jgi:formamidopyrimidine-DNA glycosylase
MDITEPITKIRQGEWIAMPELPEMENYRKQLQPLIHGKKVTDADIQRPKSLNVTPELFVKEVVGTSIKDIERRAKHILFHLSSGKILLLHLMLGGSMFFGSEEDKPDHTAQVTLSFDDKHLYFTGLRLGYLHLHTVEEIDKLLDKLGPEPLDRGFKLNDFKSRLAAKTTNLKVTLVDQGFLSGIGNCYSDEICFDARLLPARKANSLNPAEQAQLYDSMLRVLKEAIKYGGYMEPLFAGDKVTGQFDSMCKVYDREGESCTRCGHPLIKKELSSKKCFYCSNCQR